MKKIHLYSIVIASLIFGQCRSLTSLKQGYYANKAITTTEKVDCVFSDNPYYTTKDYLLFQCASDPKHFYYLPIRLSVENDLNGNPLVFSQWLRKTAVNIIIKFCYEKEPFVEAYNYIKSKDASNNLFLLPVHSVSITPLTGLPRIHINFSGTSTYAFFEGYVTFELKGSPAIDSMRSLLHGAAGFQMNYQFKFLTQRNGVLVQKVMNSIIHIENINF